MDTSYCDMYRIQNAFLYSNLYANNIHIYVYNMELILNPISHSKLYSKTLLHFPK